MPEQHRYKYKKKEVDSVDLVRNGNKVLVKIAERNTEAKTDSGIILISSTDTDWNPAVHSDRYGIVYRVPPNLKFDHTPFSMTWETTIEIEEGDEVWFDFMNSENCIVIECDDGFEYKLLDYENLYVARRGNQIIPLNGYCLFGYDEVEEVKNGVIRPYAETDKKFGNVLYTANPNTAYQTKMFSDHIDIEVGDRVMFGHRAHHYFMEDEQYQKFPEKVRPVQRRNVAAVMDGDKIARLAENTVMVKPHKESVLPSGIIVPVFRQDLQHFKAEVTMSNHPEINTGDWVLCPKVAPLRHTEEDVEYYILGEEEIYFVWKESQ
jgi:co-chaperonin GroES (HSP10)